MARADDSALKAAEANPVNANAVILESTLTCPRCGHMSVEVMPEDACLYFHECSHCHALLRPKQGQCCVFCSYGSVPCPPVQTARGCCETSVGCRQLSADGKD